MPMEDRNVLLSKATLITVLLFVSTLAHKANQMSPVWPMASHRTESKQQLEPTG